MRRRMLTAAVAIAALVAACGVPTDSNADVADPDDVPFGLLDDATTTTTRPPNEAVPTGPAIHLCLTRDHKVVPLTRTVAQMPGKSGDLKALIGAEPNESEVAAGLSSALPDPRPVVEVDVVGGVGVVDLEGSFSDLPADRQLLAVAQVVCTLTSQPGVGQVRFTLEGDHVDVPRQDGSLSAAPVTREDYDTMISS